MRDLAADSREMVIVVDEQDEVVGTAPKLDVHRTGALHRAVSVFITDGQGRVLLQQRAATKYHSPLLWTNTCCGHPRPGETPLAAAHRRLLEEMGMQCPLEPAGSFRYRAALEGGLIEHEIDHVFVGRAHARPHPDPLEVEAWRWEPLAPLERDIAMHAGLYTAWLAEALAVARRHPAMQGGDGGS